MAKNLLICFDGTWNKAQGVGSKEEAEVTNVWRLFQLATGTEEKDGKGWLGEIYQAGKGSSSCYKAQQIAWYDAGVGTAWYERLRGGLFGHGLDENIVQGYEALAELYEDGDKIFLCGFSRGAYTARSLAGLINMCGLVDREKITAKAKSFQEVNTADLMKDACAGALTLYREQDGNSEANGLETNLKIMAFREHYSRGVSIECIAVWDTVKALGLPSAFVQCLPFGLGERYNEAKYGFHDDSLSPIVRHGYHALAIDEHREDFAPVLWDDIKEKESEEKNFYNQQLNNVHLSISNSSSTEINKKNAPQSPQYIEQRWFCGAHSDVGGGYASRALSDQSLIWMCTKLADCGLLLQDLPDVDAHENSSILEDGSLLCPPITDSFRDFYTLTYRWQSRHIRPLHAQNSTVSLDPSVLQRLVYDASYRPQNEGLADLLGWTK